MTLVLLFALIALLIFSLTLLSNLFVFPRLRPAPRSLTSLKVAILIPARNEASVISHTVRAFLHQDYPHFELLILDDHSSDGTIELVRSAAQADPRIKVLQGADLPAGWMGKPYACHQLAQATRADWLIFTDADTQWSPSALSALLYQLQHTQADLLTVWPRQITVTWSERVVVPLMMMVIMAYLPIIMTHYSPFATFSAANGQCMAWRRSLYERIGGHTLVANNVLDDVTLARSAKRAGARLRMVTGDSQIACRMYNDWNTVRDGFAKNILAGYGNSIVALLLASVFHWVVFLLPYALLWSPDASTTQLALACLVLGLLIRAISAVYTRQRWLDALSLPLGVLLMTRIAFQALAWRFRRQATWKGRRIPT
jgi:chlorobactene glucosyltransferase